MKWVNPASVFIAVSAFYAADSLESAETNSIAVWDVLARASAGGGYRDNVLRTSVAPESSPFFYSSGEFSAIRLTDTGAQGSLFLFIEDWRYTDAPSVGSEQLASVSLQGSCFLSDDAEAGGEFQYIYQNQVVDASEDDSSLRRLLVQGNGFLARPRIKTSLSSAWSLQFEAIAMRQLYDSTELDDYWEPAARGVLTRKYGNRSEISCWFQTSRRLFDTREQYTTEGNSITNTSLEYWRPEVGAQWRHYWDKKRHWRTTTKAGWLWNLDNGSGYFDYDRFTLSQYLRWSDQGWEVRFGGRLGLYAYSVQQVNGDNRERSYYLVDLRVERRLSKHLYAFVSAEREWDFSNDPLDEYNDWTASGGIGVEF